MVVEERMEDPPLQSEVQKRNGDVTSLSDEITSKRSDCQENPDKFDSYFIAEVMHFTFFIVLLLVLVYYVMSMNV